MKLLIELIIFIILSVSFYYFLKIMYALIKILTKPNEKKEKLRKERQMKNLEKDLKTFNEKYK